MNISVRLVDMCTNYLLLKILDKNKRRNKAIFEKFSYLYTTLSLPLLP